MSNQHFYDVENNDVNINSILYCIFQVNEVPMWCEVIVSYFLQF